MQVEYCPCNQYFVSQAETSSSILQTELHPLLICYCTCLSHDISDPTEQRLSPVIRPSCLPHHLTLHICSWQFLLHLLYIYCQLTFSWIKVLLHLVIQCIHYKKCHGNSLMSSQWVFSLGPALGWTSMHLQKLGKV